MPGRLSKFGPDEYRTPYLKQAIIRRQSDPISAFVREHVAQAQVCYRGQRSPRLRDLVAGTTQCEPPVEANAASAIDGFAAALPRAAGATAPRCLVVNPLSFARNIAVELPDWEHPPAVAGNVLAAARRTAGNWRWSRCRHGLRLARAGDRRRGADEGQADRARERFGQ